MFKNKKENGILIAGIVLIASLFVLNLKDAEVNTNSNNKLISIKDFNESNSKSEKKEEKKEKKKEELSEEEKEVQLVNNIVKENKDNLVVLCNRNIKLGEEYNPTDLVVPNTPLVYPRTFEQSQLRKEAVQALEEMFKEAKKQGLEDLFLVSGYRSYKYQYQIYNNSLKNRGEAHTKKYMAEPGYSEHQTGLTADISTRSAGFTLEESFENTKEGQWLAENAHKFGFILRYPKDKVDVTGYTYEPWHFRYVGKTVSQYMKKYNLVLEELYDGVAVEVDAIG